MGVFFVIILNYALGNKMQTGKLAKIFIIGFACWHTYSAVLCENVFE